jgi:serine/threonine protein kinase
MLHVCIRPPFAPSTYSIGKALSGRPISPYLTCTRTRAPHAHAQGVLYLHSRPTPIIHRDLKPQNLLVKQDWTVKVGDFGLSTVKTSTMLGAATANVVGTLAWAAPELLKNQQYDERVDTYSYGVVLYQLATDRQPYQGLYKDERILLAQRVYGTAPALMDTMAADDGDDGEEDSCAGGGGSSSSSDTPGAAGGKAGAARGKVVIDMRVRALLRRCLAEHAAERPRFGEILETLQRLQAEHVGLGPREPAESH